MRVRWGVIGSRMPGKYMSALEAPDPRPGQGATTKAYQESRYVEEEQRRPGPEMAPPSRQTIGRGARGTGRRCS